MRIFMIITSPIYWAFATSLLSAVLIVLTQRWHGVYSLDDISGIQKTHTVPTPRIGGIAIVSGVIAACWAAASNVQYILLTLLLAGFPAFAFGLAEDLTKKIGIWPRLMATMASGVMAWWLTGVSITSVDISWLNTLLTMVVVSVFFTAFAVAGVANAINIIDGFNGLAAGYVVMALLGIGVMAMSVQDMALASSCWIVSAAVLGFWVINWPWGKLFLGDGGSYFTGYALAWACVMLMERNAAITAFAPLLVCIYPVTEVLFSVYRRKLRHKHPGHPDRLHLHNLIMRRLVRSRLHIRACMSNSAAGLFVALMSVPPIVVAYAVEQSILWGAVMCLVFMLGYVCIYARLVCFHWCSPIAFLFFKPVRRMSLSS